MNKCCGVALPTHTTSATFSTLATPATPATPDLPKKVYRSGY